MTKSGSMVGFTKHSPPIFDPSINNPRVFNFLFAFSFLAKEVQEIVFDFAWGDLSPINQWTKALNYGFDGVLYVKAELLRKSLAAKDKSPYYKVPIYERLPLIGIIKLGMATIQTLVMKVEFVIDAKMCAKDNEPHFKGFNDAEAADAYNQIETYGIYSGITDLNDEVLNIITRKHWPIAELIARNHRIFAPNFICEATHNKSFDLIDQVIDSIFELNLLHNVWYTYSGFNWLAKSMFSEESMNRIAIPILLKDPSHPQMFDLIEHRDNEDYDLFDICCKLECAQPVLKILIDVYNMKPICTDSDGLFCPIIHNNKTIVDVMIQEKNDIGLQYVLQQDFGRHFVLHHREKILVRLIKPKTGKMNKSLEELLTNPVYVDILDDESTSIPLIIPPHGNYHLINTYIDFMNRSHMDLSSVTIEQIIKNQTLSHDQQERLILKLLHIWGKTLFANTHAETGGTGKSIKNIVILVMKHDYSDVYSKLNKLFTVQEIFGT